MSRPEAVRIFGKMLAAKRRERGITQEKLAELAGLHPNAIGLIERGELSPTLTTLMMLAPALGMKLSELMQLLEEALPATPGA